jgi:hypothetical protein
MGFVAALSFPSHGTPLILSNPPLLLFSAAAALPPLQNERHYRLQLVSTADLFAAMDADGATRTVALDAFAGAAGL